MFPADAHMKYLPRGNTLTSGQMLYLYNFYEEGVSSGKIPYYDGGAPVETIKYLVEKSNISYTNVLGFLLALKDYAIEKKTEWYRIPELKAQENAKASQSISDFITKPIDVITKSIGTGAKNISEPITRPLLFLSVIAGSSVLLYAGWKFGIFKKIKKNIVRNRKK